MKVKRIIELVAVFIVMLASLMRLFVALIQWELSVVVMCVGVFLVFAAGCMGSAKVKRIMGLVVVFILILASAYRFKQVSSESNWELFFAGLGITLLFITYFVALLAKNLKVTRIAYYILLCILLIGIAVVFAFGPVSAGLQEGIVTFLKVLIGWFIIYVLPFGMLMYLLWKGLTGLRQIIEEENQFLEAYRLQKEKMAEPSQENKSNK